LVATIPGPSLITRALAIGPAASMLAAAIRLASDVTKMSEVPGHAEVTKVSRKRVYAATCAVPKAVAPSVTRL